CFAAVLTALLHAFLSSRLWLRIFVATSAELIGRPVRLKGRAIRTLAGGEFKVWDIPYPPSCGGSYRDNRGPRRKYCPPKLSPDRRAKSALSRFRLLGIEVSPPLHGGGCN